MRPFASVTSLIYIRLGPWKSVSERNILFPISLRSFVARPNNGWGDPLFRFVGRHILKCSSDRCEFKLYIMTHTVGFLGLILPARMAWVTRVDVCKIICYATVTVERLSELCWFFKASSGEGKKSRVLDLTNEPRWGRVLILDFGDVESKLLKFRMWPPTSMLTGKKVLYGRFICQRFQENSIEKNYFFLRMFSEYL